MGERCRCGAELLPHLHFCVGCGADRPTGGPAYRPAPVPGRSTAAPSPVTAPSPVAAPSPTWPGGTPTTWPQPATGPRPTFPDRWQAHTPAPQVTQWAAPAPARASSPAPWAIVLSVLLVLLVASCAALFTLRPELLTGRSSAEAAPVVTAAAPIAPPSQPTALSAHDELGAQVDRDRAQVESVTGSWVPQLSSKRPGTVDAGVTYDDAAILGHYRGLAAQYPGTALLWSGDWPVFKGDDYWVVIVAQPFATAAQANAWCDQQGFGTDDCLAKNLSHSGGPAGTTVSR